MDTLRQDMRFAMRTLWRAPGFTVVAVLCLALGIAANTTMFSSFYAMFLQPMPFPSPNELYTVHQVDGQSGREMSQTSYPNMRDWAQADSADVAAWGVYQTGSASVGDATSAEHIDAATMTPGAIRALGVQPAFGRVFTADEGQAGRNQVVLLGWDLWQRRFGGDSTIVGTPVMVDGTSRLVVGVMPRGFSFPAREQLWTALDEHAIDERGNHSYDPVLRVKPNADLVRLQQSMANAHAQIAHQIPMEAGTVRLRPLRTEFVGDQMKALLLVMLGAVGFVLLIACANVANLLLARAAARQREIGVRVALGASRVRIMRQLLTESLLLAIMGGVVGVVLATWGVDLIRTHAPATLPEWVHYSVNGTVLLFTATITVLTGLVFGLAPALHAGKTDLNESLKDGARGGSLARHRLRQALVIGEIGLAVVLLAGAMLMVRSLSALRSTDPGFVSHGVLTMQVDFAGPRYDNDTVKNAAIEQIEQRIRTVPGVSNVGTTFALPLSGMEMIRGGIQLVGEPPAAPGQRRDASFRGVTSGYFTALGIPVKKGRAFTADEVRRGDQLALVNETMAKHFWPNEDPIGREMHMGPPTNPNIRVVGIVGDVKSQRLFREPTNQMYLPYLAAAFPTVSFAVRVTGDDPTAVVAGVRGAIKEFDPTLAPFAISTMDDIVGQSYWDRTLYGWLLSIFASLALLLAAIGVYGVMTYAVTQRTHEIGVRMALGARIADVLRMVVGDGMRLAAYGLAAGIIGAVLLTRLLRTVLFGVTATDPLTFVAVAVVLVLIALVACAVPAWRASRVQPLTALRYE